MIPLEMCPHLVEVEETLIQKAAELPGKNNFKCLLADAAAFRRAGLEPIYLMTENQESFAVTCRETYGKALH